MPLSWIFGTQTQWQASWLDTDFAEVGACTTIPCTIAGTNTLIVTPLDNTPAPTSYADYQRFGGIAAANNTGATSADAGGLGLLPVYKDGAGGPAALIGGEIKAANYVVLIYDTALNGGSGGFHLENILVGGAPTGSAGGDLGGSYPNPGVAQINGAALGSTVPTAGNVLVGSGTQWVTRSVGGDATFSLSGLLTVTKTGGVSFSGLATATFVAHTAWTPADGSGAGLSLSGISAQYERHANLVFASFALSYPVTADATAAKLQGLPVAVPNQPYAQTPQAVSVSGGSLSILLVAVQNSSTAKFVRADTGAPVTNANLSGLTLTGMLIYPVA